MDVVLNISILYNCMVSESGYEVELGKISPRVKNSRYLTKPFNINCINDFKCIFMNDNNSVDTIDKKLKRNGLHHPRGKGWGNAPSQPLAVVSPGQHGLGHKKGDRPLMKRPPSGSGWGSAGKDVNNAVDNMSQGQKRNWGNMNGSNSNGNNANMATAVTSRGGWGWGIASSKGRGWGNTTSNNNVMPNNLNRVRGGWGNNMFNNNISSIF